MSSSFLLKRFVKPTKADLLFDIEDGVKVKVYTKTDGLIVGDVRQDRHVKGRSQFLHLVNCEQVGVQKEGWDGHMGLVRLEADDINDLEVVSYPEKFVSKFKTEKVYRTIIVNVAQEFHKLMEILKGFNGQVGMNFHGVYVGRQGQVGWISLFMEDTIMCIDVITLAKKLPSFWELITQDFLANEKVMKVVYNSRPLADYMFHTCGVTLKNVFDIQVAEFHVWAQGQTKEHIEAVQARLKYKKLSECLEAFMLSEVHPEELKLLKEMEETNFANENPLMERPVTDKKTCKFVAIDVKYLLKLRELLVSRMMERLTLAMEVQMEEMIAANNAFMVHFLGHPQLIPKKIFGITINPPGAMVDAREAASAKAADTSAAPTENGSKATTSK